MIVYVVRFVFEWLRLIVQEAKNTTKRNLSIANYMKCKEFKNVSNLIGNYRKELLSRKLWLGKSCINLHGKIIKSLIYKII